MTKLDQLASPVMRSAACFNANKARLDLRKERQHLRSSQRLADDWFAQRINTVNLKNVLGQIEADCATLNDGWLLLLVNA